MRVREDIGKRRRVKYEVTSGGREEGLNMEGGPWGGEGLLHMEGRQGEGGEGLNMER